MNWKTLSSQYISQHVYFTARRDICEMPDGTIVDPYFVVELPHRYVRWRSPMTIQAILVHKPAPRIGYAAGSARWFCGCRRVFG